MWKVPIPTFKRSTVQHAPTSPVQPLSPCLVHRSPSCSPTLSPTLPKHHPTPQRSVSASASTKPAETIPLRSCCPDCVKTAEQSVRSGDDWQVKFSYGAQKRIKSLTDHNHKPISELYLVPQVVLNVDEVDKRRKSLDHQTDAPTSSCCHTRVTSSSCIREEDDEQMLFPLPSPKRSPNSSPSPRASPTPSTNSLKEATLKPSPRPQTSSPSLRGRRAPGSIVVEPIVETEVLACVESISRPHPISTVDLDSPAPPSSLSSSTFKHTRGASSPTSPTHHARLPPLTIHIPRHRSSGSEDAARSLPSQSLLTQSPTSDSRARSMSPERVKRRRPSLSAVASGVLKVGADVVRGVGSMNGNQHV